MELYYFKITFHNTMQLLNIWVLDVVLHGEGCTQINNGVTIKHTDFTSLTWMFIDNTHQQPLIDDLTLSTLLCPKYHSGTNTFSQISIYKNVTTKKMNVLVI